MQELTPTLRRLPPSHLPLTGPGQAYRRMGDRVRLVAKTGCVSAIMESHGPIDLEDESAEDLESVAGEEDAGGIARVRCYVVGTPEVPGNERPTRKP